MREQRGLDLAEFHPVAADLDLVVEAAEELQYAVRGLPDPVAAAVPAATVAFDEGCRGEFRVTEVARGQSGSGDVQFTCFAGSAGAAVLGDDGQFGACHGTADGQLPYVVGRTGVDDVAGGVDGGLGWPVQVGDPVLRSPARVDQVEPAAYVRGGQCLAAESRAIQDGTPPDLSALRWVHVGGEALPAAHVRRWFDLVDEQYGCLLYTSPSPRDLSTSRMPSSA